MKNFRFMSGPSRPSDNLGGSVDAVFTTCGATAAPGASSATIQDHPVAGLWPETTTRLPSRSAQAHFAISACCPGSRQRQSACSGHCRWRLRHQQAVVESRAASGPTRTCRGPASRLHWRSGRGREWCPSRRDTIVEALDGAAIGLRPGVALTVKVTGMACC